MADIIITFTTTVRQEEKLAKTLAFINSFRPVEQQFATVTAWLTDAAKNTALAGVRAADEREADDVRTGFVGATPAIQAQIQALLGL